ncbi:O-antigen ligase family protein [Undibacterium sp. TJN19]|uniref:O-antigen ligase family protein n=1 Tax=Undibacterium sp. TJN19 TaxID=3413055 RepID=UPI003BF40FE3
METNLIKLMIVLFVIFSLLPYGISWDYTGSSALTMEGSLTTKLQWGGLFILATFILYRHLPETLKDIRAMNPFLAIVLIWCLASSLWSPLSATTFKRAIQLYGIVMIGLSIQMAARPLHLMVNYVLYTLMGLLILSFFMAVAVPSIGIDYDLGGAWRGALSQKNELGQVAALSILLWQIKACIEKVGIQKLLFGMLFAFFMLVMSKSSTSMIITLLTSGVFHLLRKRYISSSYSLTRASLVLFCMLTVAVYVFFMHESRLPTWQEAASPIASLFGKGTDLTGRTDVWQLVWLEINKHYVMGLGYGAFWLGPDSLSQFVIDALHWIPLQSHNGYLDILNEQGLVGLIFVTLTLLTHAYYLNALSRLDRQQAAFWSAMLTVVVITNFTESSLFRGFVFQNVFFIFSLVAVSSSIRRLKIAQQTSLASAKPSTFAPKPEMSVQYNDMKDATSARKEA